MILYVAGITNEEIQEAICIFHSNAFQVFSEQNHEVLSGLYYNAAMLNHTCAKANTRPSFGDKYEIKLIAIDDIEMGEEITTSYLEPFDTLTKRKAVLRRGKCFDCECKRCLDATEFGTFASSAKCQSCKKGGYLISTDTRKIAADHQCTECGNIKGFQECMKVDQTLHNELTRVNRYSIMNDCECNASFM